MMIQGYHVDFVNISILVLDYLAHMMVGYVLVQYFTDINPEWGALGGLIPNIDLAFDLWPNVFPFVHRGILHTPLFLGIIVLIFYWNWKRATIAFSIGFIAELVLDVFESKDGIMFLYPFSDHHYAIPIPHEGIWLPLVFIITVFLAVYYVHTHSFTLPR